MINIIIQQYNIEKGVSSNWRGIGGEIFSIYWRSYKNMDAPPCFLLVLLGFVMVMWSYYTSTFLIPFCGVHYVINVKCDVLFVFNPICFVWSSCYIYINCIYLWMLASNAISVSGRWRLCRLTIITRIVPLVEQEMLTIPEHMSSPRGFVGVLLLLPLCF